MSIALGSPYNPLQAEAGHDQFTVILIYIVSSMLEWASEQESVWNKNTQKKKKNEIPRQKSYVF